MFWAIFGGVLVVLGIVFLVYCDVRSGDCEDDYYNDVPPPGMGGQA